MNKRFGSIKTWRKGVTLAELLISMVLMSYVIFSISNFIFNGNLRVASLNGRFKIATETLLLVQDIQDDLHRGAYISPNSFRNRLEYTTYDPSLVGTNSTSDALKKVYGICYYSTVQTNGNDTTCPKQGSGGTFPYLKLSMDGGATWGSPYRVSGFHSYRFASGSTPMFLFAHPSNDCTDYRDDDNDGVLGSGDTTKNPVSCSNYGSAYTGVTTSSMNPTYSSKVVLANFNFTTGTGRPETIRNLPQYIFMAVAPGLVRSDMPVTPSAGVKDSQLVQAFSFDNTVNSMWPSGLVVRDLAWDAAHERLIIGNSTLSVLYQTERNGAFINAPLTLVSDSNNYTPYGVAIEDDGNTLHVWYQDYYRRYNLGSNLPLQPTFGPVYNVTGEWSKWHLAFDPSSRNLYMAVWDTSDSKAKISPFFGSDSTSAGLPTGASKIQLPNTFSSTGQVGGLAIEPSSGDFLVVRNQVYTVSSNNYIDIYRVKSNGSYTTFSINLTDLGSTATGTNGGFDIDYDPVLNRLFLADNMSKKIYEVSPVKLLNSRN